MTTEDQLEIETRLIESWFKDTTEAFDDWDWDGTELTLFLRNQPIEKYTRDTLATIIQGFPPTQPCTTTSSRQW